MVPRTSGAAGRRRLLPGTAGWARFDPGHDGSLYPGGRTENGSGRSSASVSPVRTGLQARGQTGAKKGWIKCQVPGSRNAFGPLGANSLEPAAAPAYACGNRALARIAQEAQQDKGLWECAAGVLTKAYHYGTSVEVMFKGCHPTNVPLALRNG